MDESNYHCMVTYTVEVLKVTEQELFKAVVNLSRVGIYEDVFKAFQPGEGIKLDLEMFENTDDNNINLLSELMRHVIGIRDYLSNSIPIE